MPDSRYDPARLLDHLKLHLQARNDAALSRALDVNPPMLSKIRHGHQPMGASLLIRINEVTGLDISELNRIMGERRRHIRVGQPRAPGKLLN